MFTTKILFAAILVVSVVAAGLGWQLKLSLEKNGALKQANAQLISEIEDLNNEVDRINGLYEAADSALVKVQREKSNLQAAAGKWQRRYNELLKTDDDAQKWADEPMPESVLGVLRDDPGDSNEEGGSESPSTNSSDGADDRSAVLWECEWRLASVCEISPHPFI